MVRAHFSLWEKQNNIIKTRPRFSKTIRIKLVLAKSISSVSVESKAGVVGIGERETYPKLNHLSCDFHYLL